MDKDMKIYYVKFNNSNIKNLVSIYGDPLNNKYKYDILILFENNKFINSINCDSLIFSKGNDLETYILYITAINNIFKQNTLNIAIFDLKNAQLEITQSHINNHSVVIYATVVELEVYNVTTNTSTMLFLNDTKETDYGSRVNIYDCHFIHHANAFEIYVQPNDEINFTNCKLNQVHIVIQH